MANKLHRQVKGLSEDKSDKLNLISGNLGISLDGQKTVEVSNRDGYVWVRLRGNQSELIQAYNAAVSPIFDLPVLVVRSNNRYAVYGRDIEKYGDWGNSPYLPKHGTQHSFNPDLGMGGDVTWIYSRQFVPLLAMPSGSAGAASLVVNPHIYREPSDGSFTYIGNQGTPDATLAKPTDNQARMMLLYWDLNTNLPNMITGSLFDASITGTAQITPYIPALNDSEKIPLSAIRVVSGTTTIDWDNIYDIRQFATTTPPAFQGGFGVWDEGIPQGTGTILNFIGAGIDATVSGTVAQIVVTATGGGGGSSPWTTGSAGTNSIKAIGGGSNATGDYAVAHGQDTTATGTASTAEGIDSVARGDYSHAEGNGALARGDESHAEGYQTVAIGLDSHAEGQSSISSGTASHAEGQNNIAIGLGSHAGGVANIARGDYSSTNGGIGNRAAGQSSAALGGSENIVTGTNSATIGGVSNILIGQRSAIIGGQGITGTASDTAYMDYANVRTLNSGTAVSNVGINSQGFLVTGSSGGSAASDGWNAAASTWTYSSTDDPTGIISTSADETGNIGVGDRIRFTNGGNTIYGIVTAITSSLITFLHQIDPSDNLALTLMANSAITVPYYSHVKNPLGFPPSKLSWRIIIKDTTNASQASPGTAIYNLGSISIAIPIGLWDVSTYSLSSSVVNLAVTQLRSAQTGLSTANNSYSDIELYGLVFLATPALANAEIRAGIILQKRLSLASKTTYYLNCSCGGATAATSISFRGDLATTQIEAVCAYL